MRLSPLDSRWLERHAGWTKQEPCSRKNPTELTFFSRGNVNSNYTTSTPQANMPEPLWARQGCGQAQSPWGSLHHLEASLWELRLLVRHTRQLSLWPRVVPLLLTRMGQYSSRMPSAPDQPPRKGRPEPSTQSLIVLFHRNSVLGKKELSKGRCSLWVKGTWVTPDGVQKNYLSHLTSLDYPQGLLCHQSQTSIQNRPKPTRRLDCLKKKCTGREKLQDTGIGWASED